MRHTKKKIRANLKSHNRVYKLLSKHTYRPMRARVIAQLFYNIPSTCEYSLNYSPIRPNSVTYFIEC